MRLLPLFVLCSCFLPFARGQTITNPGFESGLSGWAAAGTALPDAFNDPTKGNIARFYGGGTGGTGTLTQTVAGLTSGIWYKVSFELGCGFNTATFSLTVDGSPVYTHSSCALPVTYTTQTTPAGFKATGTTAVLTFTGSTSGSKKRDLSSGWGLDDVSIKVCSGCGDPHFIGLDKTKYDYQGKAGGIFALVSDRFVEVNSLFVAGPASKTNTYIGPLCIRVCCDTGRFYPNGSIYINNHLQQNSSFSKQVAKQFTIDAIETSRRHRQPLIRVRFGNWSVVIQNQNRHHFDLLDLQHLSESDALVHGILGMSGRAGHHQHNKKHCHARKDGGCELVGKPQDYEIPAESDLCATHWTHSQFDAKACGCRSVV